MMLSQLNLRFHKKLTEALKTRAGRENTSVNALAERFLDDGLKTVEPSDKYFQLIADPDATIRQLYRHIILGQTFGTAPVSRDELRFILAYAREALICGQNRMATLPALSTLLDITHDLLAWQTENDRPVNDHYLKGIFRLAGENWTQEFDALLAELRPVISAVTETIEASTLRLEIRIDGQHPGARPGARYETPRLHLLITGQGFVVPYGWEAFSELLGLFTLYARYPEALAHAPASGRARDVLAARTRHEGGILRYRRPADFHAGRGL